jgi:hypothetical protein
MCDRVDEIDEKILFEVRIADLADKVNPFDCKEWGCDPIDPDDVLQALKEGRFQTESWQVVNSRFRARSFNDIAFHIERIAYLMVNPDDKPLSCEIEEDIGLSNLRVYDGNHRLAAAILRGDQTVAIEMDEWSVDKLLTVLPSATPLTSHTPPGI